MVNVDQLDYLAKRLDSFCESEDAQFQATVITNFSDLEKIGKDHVVTLRGGGMPMEQYEAADVVSICQLAENLEGFYDYRRYGEQHIQSEGGQFNECGYVAYHGTMALEELMMEDPAEQYQKEQGFQMGGLQ